MSDVEAPAVEQDQPDAPEAPETDQPVGGAEESFTDSFNPSDYPEDVRPAAEAAYKQFQAAYTKKTQGLSEGRREAERNAEIIQALGDPQSRAAVLQHFGIDLVEEAEESLLDDDEEPDLYQEVQKIKSERAEEVQQREQAAREEQVSDYIAEEIVRLEESEGREFSKSEQRAINDLAQSMWTATGPDVEGAHKLLSEVGQVRAKAILEKKTNTPRQPGLGTPGSKAADLTNKVEREAAMARRANEVVASQE